jgi:hypothetical protein
MMRERDDPISPLHLGQTVIWRCPFCIFSWEIGLSAVHSLTYPPDDERDWTLPKPVIEDFLRRINTHLNEHSTRRMVVS